MRINIGLHTRGMCFQKKLAGRASISGMDQQSDLSGTEFFRIDSRASFQISDYYQVDRPMNPDPGELFIAEWRMRTIENDGFSPDAEVVIVPDQEGTLGMGHYPDRLVSTREGWTENVTAGDFHSYRMESTDMVHYSLHIDNQLIRDGQWDLNSLNRSFLAFGDAVRGVRSVSEWDFVRFGVIPEPSSFIALAMFTVCSCHSRRRM